MAMAEDAPLTLNNFQNMMDGFGFDWSGASKVGVAVSGGPDSMALCKLLSGWGADKAIEVHALSVDHNLRAESAEEAAQVGSWLSDWSQVKHQVLNWESPSETAIQEEARRARYGLMAEYCRAHNIEHLFLGHHGDDQAETVLFRLSKGSGLDGLAGMQNVQVYDDDLVLVRPFLDLPKDDLIRFCEDQAIDFVQDPSNENTDFARVRLRRSREILEEEGLSSKRLNVTAKRLSRARKALDSVAEKAYKEAVFKNDTKCTVFKNDVLLRQPEEIILRCVLKALEKFRPEADYAPRMEKVEALLDDLIRSDDFRKRTLGGVIFERDDKAAQLILTRE